MAKIKIPTEDIEKDFDVYFKPIENRRIIFSGIFGIGKTTFLKEFFKNRSTEYFHIHLYPVNYSVASNEDIFELIKYDILYGLLNFKDIDLDKIKARVVDIIYFASQESFVKAFKPLVTSIPKIGRLIEPIVEVVENIIGLYKETEEDLNSDTLQDIKSFVRHFDTLKGSIYEMDFYSKLICEIVEQIQVKRKVVVTIDDLDRIDPEHIFRILNVFGAHLDQEHSVNKFGIDKIITCFHSKNVKNIFANKYGQDVDFSGYIDKFYSVGIYEFSNSNTVEGHIEKIFDSIKFENHFFNSNSYKQLVLILCHSFFSSGFLNLRALLKYSGEQYTVPLRSTRLKCSGRNLLLHQCLSPLKSAQNF